MKPDLAGALLVWWIASLWMSSHQFLTWRIFSLEEWRNPPISSLDRAARREEAEDRARRLSRWLMPFAAIFAATLTILAVTNPIKPEPIVPSQAVSPRLYELGN